MSRERGCASRRFRPVARFRTSEAAVRRTRRAVPQRPLDGSGRHRPLRLRRVLGLRPPCRDGASTARCRHARCRLFRTDAASESVRLLRRPRRRRKRVPALGADRFRRRCALRALPAARGGESRSSAGRSAAASRSRLRSRAFTSRRWRVSRPAALGSRTQTHAGCRRRSSSRAAAPTRSRSPRRCHSTMPCAPRIGRPPSTSTRTAPLAGRGSRAPWASAAQRSSSAATERWIDTCQRAVLDRSCVTVARQMSARRVTHDENRGEAPASHYAPRSWQAGAGAIDHLPLPSPRPQ